jgi:hypothetical protein
MVFIGHFASVGTKSITKDGAYRVRREYSERLSDRLVLY